MQIPSPSEMLARLNRMPAGSVLLERLGPATEVHLVGGGVRDLLLGLAPPDLDLVVDGDAPAIARALDPAAQVHDRFGTATFILAGHVFDIARSRRERYRIPGALPEVEPAGLQEDLSRRDFSVNAMAMALGGKDAGLVKAVPRALDDLEAQRLRVLHEESFRDDPTRLLRLARYASRLGFRPEPHTSSLAEEAVAAGALTTVSGNRLGAELGLLAREPDPVSALAELDRLDLAAGIHPGFGDMDQDRARRALELLAEHGRSDLLVLGMACERLAEPELSDLLNRLGFQAAERGTIVAVATGSRRVADALAHARTPSQIATAIAGAAAELVAAAGSRGPYAQAESWLSELRHISLEIDGSDLRAAGVQEGPAIGRGLRAALLAKLDGSLSGREQELAYAVRAAGNGE